MLKLKFIKPHGTIEAGGTVQFSDAERAAALVEAGDAEFLAAVPPTGEKLLAQFNQILGRPAPEALNLPDRTLPPADPPPGGTATTQLFSAGDDVVLISDSERYEAKFVAYEQKEGQPAIKVLLPSGTEAYAHPDAVQARVSGTPLPSDLAGVGALGVVGITTVEQVASMTDQQLDDVNGIGPSTVAEIRTRLGQQPRP
jgi:hypothetical protein